MMSIDAVVVFVGAGPVPTRGKGLEVRGDPGIFVFDSQT